MRRGDEPAKLDADVCPVAIVALDGCERLSTALEGCFARGAIGYQYRCDAAYREVRRRVIADLRADPCLARLAKTADRFLPRSLAQCAYIPTTWWTDPSTGGRMQLIALQDRILTTLDKAGQLLCVLETAPAAAVATAPSSDFNSKGNHAQRRADERMRRAQKLRKEDKTIKEIARTLGCSERTVANYLREDG